MSQRTTIIFLWGFIVIGAVSFGIGCWTFYRSVRSESWPTTEGVIESAEMKSHSGGEDGTTYSAEVAYSYRVAGENYEGEKVSIGQMSSSSGYARGILNHYPVGKKVSVHYAPGDPSEAVLETGIHGGTWICLAVGTAFALAGIMFLQIQRAAIKAQLPGAPPSGIHPNPDGSISMDKPPVLFGVIFLLAGIGISLVPPDSGKPHWLMYAVGGVFVSAGVMALAMRLKNKNYQQLATIPFLVLFLAIFNWVGFVAEPKSAFTAFAILFDALIPVAVLFNLWKRLRN